MLSCWQLLFAPPFRKKAPADARTAPVQAAACARTVKSAADAALLKDENRRSEHGVQGAFFCVPTRLKTLSEGDFSGFEKDEKNQLTHTFVCVRILRLMWEGVYMYKDISENKFVVGTKQTLKAIKSGNAAYVYLAEDADEEIRQRVIRNCNRHGVSYEMAPGMKELGRACNISLSAAVACNIK